MSTTKPKERHPRAALQCGGGAKVAGIGRIKKGDAGYELHIRHLVIMKGLTGHIK